MLSREKSFSSPPAHFSLSPQLSSLDRWTQGPGLARLGWRVGWVGRVAGVQLWGGGRGERDGCVVLRSQFGGGGGGTHERDRQHLITPFSAVEEFGPTSLFCATAAFPTTTTATRKSAQKIILFSSFSSGFTLCQGSPRRTEMIFRSPPLPPQAPKSSPLHVPGGEGREEGSSKSSSSSDDDGGSEKEYFSHSFLG